jgi:hypothetical protein
VPPAVPIDRVGHHEPVKRGWKSKERAEGTGIDTSAEIRQGSKVAGCSRAGHQTYGTCTSTALREGAVRRQGQFVHETKTLTVGRVS